MTVYRYRTFCFFDPKGVPKCTNSVKQEDEEKKLKKMKKEKQVWVHGVKLQRIIFAHVRISFCLPLGMPRRLALAESIPARIRRFCTEFGIGLCKGVTGCLFFSDCECDFRRLYESDQLNHKSNILSCLLDGELETYFLQNNKNVFKFRPTLKFLEIIFGLS